jgi:hypothetical protein
MKFAVLLVGGGPGWRRAVGARRWRWWLYVVGTLEVFVRGRGAQHARRVPSQALPRFLAAQAQPPASLLLLHRVPRWLPVDASALTLTGCAGCKAGAA